MPLSIPISTKHTHTLGCHRAYPYTFAVCLCIYVNIHNIFSGVLFNIPIPLHKCVHLCVYTHIFLNLYFFLYTAQSFERMSYRVPVDSPSPLLPLYSPYIQGYFVEAELCLMRIDCLPGDLSQYMFLAPPEDYTHKQNPSTGRTTKLWVIFASISWRQHPYTSII